MKSIILFSILLIPATINAQRIKFSKDFTIDTLYVSFRTSVNIESDMQQKLDSLFNNVVTEFNNSNNSFVISTKHSNNSNAIQMQMSDIRYITNKWSFIGITANMVLLTADIIMISNNIYVIIPPVLIPAASGKIEMDIPDFMLDKRNSVKWLNIRGSGYFMKTEKQKNKIQNKFTKKVALFFYRFDKQNIENKINIHE